MNTTLQRKFQSILKDAEKCKATIAIDWLAINFKDDRLSIPEQTSEDEIYELNADTFLKNTGKATVHFKTVWLVMHKGQHLANILAHSRNYKIIRKGLVKVEFLNSLLYSSDLWPFYEYLVELLSLTYSSVNRLDVAIDGCNYLIDFLNAYEAQDELNSTVGIKGKRQRFDAKVYDHDKFKFQNFSIGKGRKQIVVYNKSLEIVTSGKEYIQSYWKANGLIGEPIPNHLIKERNSKKNYLDGYENIFRWEMRLKSEMIKKIKGFSIDRLKDADYLASMVKRFCEKNFEFYYKDNASVARCTAINPLPMKNWDIQSIALEDKKEKTHLFKTKLTIHKNVSQLLEGKWDIADYALTESLVFDIENYKLHKWFLIRLPKWIKEYELTQPDVEIRNQSVAFLQDFATKVEANKLHNLIN